MRLRFLGVVHSDLWTSGLSSGDRERLSGFSFFKSCSDEGSCGFCVDCASAVPGWLGSGLSAFGSSICGSLSIPGSFLTSSVSLFGILTLLASSISGWLSLPGSFFTSSVSLFGILSFFVSSVCAWSSSGSILILSGTLVALFGILTLFASSFCWLSLSGSFLTSSDSLLTLSGSLFISCLVAAPLGPG